MNKYKEDDHFYNSFFNELIGKKITVYLISGIKLNGILLNYDEKCILIDGKIEKIEGKPQLVFKNAISTVLPNSL